MTQEKQNSIRILQNKPAKKSLSKSIVFLLGVLIGFIVSSILFLIFFNTNKIPQIEENSSEILHQNESEKVNNFPSEPNHEDNDSITYRQHVNEKDLKNLFKHENKNLDTNSLNKTSPFEQINGSDKKPLKPTQPPVSKPIVKEQQPRDPKIKTIPAAKAEEKQIPTTNKEVEDVSPVGSVKVSIDRRQIENKP